MGAAMFASMLTAILGGPAGAVDEPVAVFLSNHQFEPKVIEVRSGQTLRFDNVDSALHSLQLVGHENLIGEEFVDPGQSYTVRIPLDFRPGTYELVCTIHVDMRATIVVDGG